MRPVKSDFMPVRLKAAILHLSDNFEESRYFLEIWLGMNPNLTLPSAYQRSPAFEVAANGDGKMPETVVSGDSMQTFLDNAGSTANGKTSAEGVVKCPEWTCTWLFI